MKHLTPALINDHTGVLRQFNELKDLTFIVQHLFRGKHTLPPSSHFPGAPSSGQALVT